MFYVKYSEISKEYHVLHTDDNTVYANYVYEMDAVNFTHDLNRLS